MTDPSSRPVVADSAFPGSASLVLASSSPRRAHVLRALGLTFLVDPAELAEVQSPRETPTEFVERLAREKAAMVAARHPGAWVLAGDTIVIVDDRVLGKPGSEGEAMEMLLDLAGREHEVATGLALASPEGGMAAGVDRTRVRFRSFGAHTARAYVATGEPLDKAGAYGIQGMGGALVRRIDGDYFTVMGFPVSLFVDLLERMGLRYAFGRLEPGIRGEPES